MLQRSERIEDADEMLWELTLVLLLAWIIVYVCVVRGIKSSGKVTDQIHVLSNSICVHLIVR